MTTNDLDWDRMIRKAAQVARIVAREWPGIETSDIEQEILLHAAENKATYLKANYSDAQLHGIFLRVGRKYAGRERYTFIHYSAEWIYTPTEIRAIFEEAFFDPIVWENAPQKDDGFTITARNVVVSLWDIDAAFEALDPDEQVAIRSRYEFGIPGNPAERKTLQRAIDKVTQKINGRLAAKNEATNIDVYTLDY